MATDIWIRVEYQKKVKHKYKYVYVPEMAQHGDRRYGLFAIMAGICWDYGVLYPVRGLPVDASPEIANEYNADSTFFHHASWLSTEEFKNCLDKYTFYLTQRGVEPSEIEDCLKNYMRIYRYMQSSDADGEPARIVFWFDN